METYRLNSKLIDNKKEYLIKTINDVSIGAVQSEIYIDGSIAEQLIMPHPEQLNPEEVLSLVQNTHNEQKTEIEKLLSTVKKVMDQGDPEMILNLGLAFFYKKFYDEGLKLLKNAIGLKEDFHQAYFHISQIELIKGNVSNAVTAGSNAVRIRPEFADYRNNLGEAYLAGKKYKEAITEFERATSINLYYGDAYYNYGLTLLSKACDTYHTERYNDYISKAKEHFTKSSLINNSYQTSLFEKGMAALEATDIKIAYELLKKVRLEKKENDRKISAPYYMKFALHPQWVTEKAIVDRIEYLQKELKDNPSYIDLYAELSRCFLIHARLVWRKGVENYKKTLEFNPSLSKLYETLDKAEEINHQIEQLVNEIEKQS